MVHVSKIVSLALQFAFYEWNIARWDLPNIECCTRTDGRLETDHNQSCGLGDKPASTFAASINHKYCAWENYRVWRCAVWKWRVGVSKVGGNERESGGLRQVTGLGLCADGLSSDGQRPALHLSSSQINNRREQWAKTARRDWVSESRYSKCNAIYQCHSRQSMLAKHTANTHILIHSIDRRQQARTSNPWRRCPFWIWIYSI